MIDFTYNCLKSIFGEVLVRFGMAVDGQLQCFLSRIQVSLYPVSIFNTETKIFFYAEKMLQIFIGNTYLRNLYLSIPSYMASIVVY